MSDDDDLYDVVDEPAPSRQRNPTAPAKAGEGAVGRLQRLEYRQATTPGTSAVDQYFPDRVKDLYLPLGLIGGGTVIRVGFALLFSLQSAPVAIGRLGTEMLAGTALMLVAVLIVGKLRSISFGPLPVAVMKLCAVAIAPPAIGILLAPIFMLIPLIGGFGVAIVNFAMSFALLGALFDLDESDTWFCVCVIFLIGVGVFLAMRSLGW
jgi:hypothetical protein